MPACLRPLALVLMVLSPAAPAAAAGPDTVRLALRAPLAAADLDPTAAVTAEAWDVIRQLHAPLATEDPADGRPRPALAAGWTAAPGFRVWRVTVRDGLRWPDGSLITAADVVRGWQELAAGRSPAAGVLARMGLAGAGAVLAGTAAPAALGIAAPDARTLVLTLDRPNAALPAFLTAPALVPRHPADPTQESGAYRLQATDAAGVRLAGNPAWAGPPPAFAAARFVVHADAAAMLAAFAAGDLDRAPVPPAWLTRLGASAAHAAALPAGCTEGWLLGRGEGRAPALDDPALRRALSAAIPRAAITDRALLDGQRPATRWTHWAIPGLPESAAVAPAMPPRTAAPLDPLALAAEDGAGEDGAAAEDAPSPDPAADPGQAGAPAALIPDPAQTGEDSADPAAPDGPPTANPTLAPDGNPLTPRQGVRFGLPDGDPAQPLARLLAQRGHDEDAPLRLTLYTNADDTALTVARFVHRSLAPAGVALRIVDLPWPALAERLGTGAFPLARFGWCAEENSPAAALAPFRSGGAAGWSDPAFDAAMAAADASADPAPHWARAEAILAATVPVVPLYHYATVSLIAPTLAGVTRTNPSGRWYLADWSRVP